MNIDLYNMFYYQTSFIKSEFKFLILYKIDFNYKPLWFINDGSKTKIHWGIAISNKNKTIFFKFQIGYQ